VVLQEVQELQAAVEQVVPQVLLDHLVHLEVQVLVVLQELQEAVVLQEMEQLVFKEYKEAQLMVLALI
tara:strand:- start:958 stop:1161 length:204 start_codon:yes stop_codon:yes gene_type:complete